MEKEIAQAAIAQLGALGHPQRLAVFRLLMRHFPEPMAAGDIAAAMDVKPSTLSVYLTALRQSGLITQERSGTSLLYRADLDGAERLVGYLFEDCCRGRPQICAPEALGHRPFNVLFLCSGNSARSIMAEALLRAQGPQFHAFSAGLHPATLNPETRDLLIAKGHAIEGLHAKHISVFQQAEAPKMDFVFTVCDLAANEECPAWPGQPVSAHWGQPDPVKVTGTEAERGLAFQTAYATLKHRIEAFAALPIATLDRMSLQAHVDEISQMRPE